MCLRRRVIVSGIGERLMSSAHPAAVAVAVGVGVRVQGAWWRTVIGIGQCRSVLVRTVALGCGGMAGAGLRKGRVYRGTP